MIAQFSWYSLQMMLRYDIRQLIRVVDIQLIVAGLVTRICSSSTLRLVAGIGADSAFSLYNLCSTKKTIQNNTKICDQALSLSLHR